MTRAMLLGELLPELEGLSADLAITGLVQDSREVTLGDAFVAIAGFGAHGLKFAADAQAAGAAIVLYEPPVPPGTVMATPGPLIVSVPPALPGVPLVPWPPAGMTMTNC